MNMGRFFCGVSAALAIGLAALGHAHGSLAGPVSRWNRAASAGKADLPPVMLWAWEGPDDLRSIDTGRAGVAFLARTVFLVGDDVVVRPRLQPLRVPLDATLLAVVRIEAQPARLGRDGAGPIGATLSARQRQALVRAIASVADEFPAAAGLQLDFDATLSQRAFYKNTLTDLRSALPPDVPLQITALASWCLGDDWLDDAPIDDATPMLFRMGAGARDLRLDSDSDFRSPACRHSLGISTDERLANLPAGRRLYIFNPRAWTPETTHLAIEEVTSNAH
jgi:hypothetical protein